MKFILKMLVLLVCAISISNPLTAQAPITNLSQLNAGAQYKIINVHDGRALCTLHNAEDGDNKGNQEPMILFDYYGNASQHWKFQSLGGNTFSLLNMVGGRSLCTMHNSKDGAHKGNQEQVIQYQYYGDPTQKWRLEHLGNGNWTIRNVHDTWALSTLHNSADPAYKGIQEPIIIFDYYGNSTQLWKIVPLQASQPETRPAGAGWTANRVEGERNGEKTLLVQTGTKEWQERITAASSLSKQPSKSRTVQSKLVQQNWQEVNRDQWSVYLRFGSRNLQLDLHRREMVYDNKTIPVTSYDDALRGYTASGIVHGRGNGARVGRFTQLAGNNWEEVSDEGNRYTFQETHRDEWSVYLDKSDGAKLMIDLHRKVVRYQPRGGGAWSDIYTVLESN